VILARRGSDRPYVFARSFNCIFDVAAQGLASISIPIYAAIWQSCDPVGLCIHYAILF